MPLITGKKIKGFHADMTPQIHWQNYGGFKRLSLPLHPSGDPLLRTPSRKFSILENFTRRALQRILSRPGSINLPGYRTLPKKNRKNYTTMINRKPSTRFPRGEANLNRLQRYPLLTSKSQIILGIQSQFIQPVRFQFYRDGKRLPLFIIFGITG